MSADGKSAAISVTISESALPIGRQFTHSTSVQFLVIALVAIGVLVLGFLRYRAVAPELEELGKGGGEGGGEGRSCRRWGPQGPPFPSFPLPRPVSASIK